MTIGMMTKVFENRTTAGLELASLLQSYKTMDGIVLALPRGGIPVAIEIAKYLNWPMDVFMARKIGAPFNPEFGIGAIAEGGIIVWDESWVMAVGASKQELDDLVSKEELEIQRRVDAYRGNRRPPQVKNMIVILVDDGLATGVTAQAAIRSLKLQHPKKLVLAVPVCARDTMLRLKSEADEILCVHAPFNFQAVGLWYRNFEQLSDADVIKLLSEGRKGAT
jgi:putative phosphoribosyl transferase